MKPDVIIFSNQRAHRALVKLAQSTWNLTTSAPRVEAFAKNPPRLVVVDDDFSAQGGLAVLKQLQSNLDSALPCLLLRPAAASLVQAIPSALGIKRVLDPLDFTGLYREIQEQLALPQSERSETVAEIIRNRESIARVTALVSESEFESSEMQNCINFLLNAQPYTNQQRILEFWIQESKLPTLREYAVQLILTTQRLEQRDLLKLLTTQPHSVETTLQILRRLRIFTLSSEEVSQLKTLFAESSKLVQVEIAALILESYRFFSARLRKQIQEQIIGNVFSPSRNWPTDDDLIDYARAQKHNLGNHDEPEAEYDSLFDHTRTASKRTKQLQEIQDNLSTKQLHHTLVRLMYDRDKAVALGALSALLSEKVWNIALAQKLALEPELPDLFRQAIILSIVQRSPVPVVEKVVDSLINEESPIAEETLVTASRLMGSSFHKYLKTLCTAQHRRVSVRCWAIRCLRNQKAEGLEELCQTLHHDDDEALRSLAWRTYFSLSDTVRRLNYQVFTEIVPAPHLLDAINGLGSQVTWTPHILVPLIQDNEQPLPVRKRVIRMLERSSTPFLSRVQIQHLNDLFQERKRVEEEAEKPPPLPAKNDPSFARTDEIQPVTNQQLDYVLADATIPDEVARLPSEAIQPVMPSNLSSVHSVNSSDQEKQSKQRNQLRERNEEASSQIKKTDYNALLHEALTSEDRMLHNLTELVKKAECPETIRCKAFETILAIAPQASQTREVIEIAIRSGKTELQHQALAPDLHPSDSSGTTLKHAVFDLGNDIGIRIRALRALQTSGLPKERFIETCEQLFYDYSAELRQKALELVFPSIRFAHASDIENQLINLSEEHPSDRVRCSAALALGAFGKQKAYEYLKREKGKLFTGQDFRKAASQAVALLSQRLGISEDS